MEQKHTLDELRAHLADIVKEIKDLGEKYENRDFDPDAQDMFDNLRVEKEQTEKKIAAREAREEYLKSLESRDSNVENEPKFAPFQTRKASVVPDNPTDLDEYRVRARNLDELEQAYRDGARKVLESRYTPQLHGVSKEEAQSDIDKLIGMDREVALRTIVTSSPAYKREFGMYLKTNGGVIGQEMQRAASLTTTAGGYAVPVELDTTLLITNAGVISPIRQLADVRQTNRNTYEFLNTAGITASWDGEAAEVSDDAPTLAQPIAYLEKAQAFVPMSIEISEDWQNIMGDLARGFADAKERLESSAYLTGLGHSSSQPQGLIASGGATSVYVTATTAVLAVADLYGFENQLSPRYRRNASLVMSKAAANKIRQFDTAGGANLWEYLGNGTPGRLLGYPTYEWSDITSAVTTSGSTIAVFGDFSYFKIIDRTGLNVDFIPHLFSTVAGRPTGQRGLYAYWRTTSQVASPVNTVSSSAFQALKLL